MDTPEKAFKLKSILDLGSMTKEELITYIDSLHNTVLNYQLVIDQVVAKNVNVKR